MPQGYSVYVVGDDGHFKKRFDFSCDNDAEAKSRAEQMLDGHAVELWQEERRVVTFLPSNYGRPSGTA